MLLRPLPKLFLLRRPLVSSQLAPSCTACPLHALSEAATNLFFPKTYLQLVLPLLERPAAVYSAGPAVPPGTSLPLLHTALARACRVRYPVTSAHGPGSGLSCALSNAVFPTFHLRHLLDLQHSQQMDSFIHSFIHSITGYQASRYKS